MKFLILVAMFLTLVSFSSGAIAINSIGNITDVNFNDSITYLTTDKDDLTIDGILGKRLYILEKSIALQKYGYQHIYPDTNDYFAPCVSYSELAGKIVKITNIIKDSSANYKLTLLDETSGKYYKTTAYPLSEKIGNHINDVAYYDDLDKAKQNWLNTTVYLKTSLLYTYNAKTEEIKKFKVDKYTSVKIVDVQWSMDDYDPITLVLECRDKKIGAVDTRYSYTNSTKSTIDESKRPWFKTFMNYDPQTKYKISNSDWELIKAGKVKVGFSKINCELAWGAPSSINKTTTSSFISEQWVYGLGLYLYFVNDTLSSIQN